MKALLMGIILYLLPTTTTNQQQEKRYNCQLTVNQWEQVLSGISSSNQLSASTANGLVQTITTQINQQIAYDKKVADSLSKVKTKKP